MLREIGPRKHLEHNADPNQEINAMRKYFTAQLNKLAWKIKKSQGLTWGESLRLAMRLDDLPEHGMNAKTSLLGDWTRASVDAVAGHFWGLSKAYSELGDTGRSIAMNRVAKAFYNMLGLQESVTLTSLKGEKFFGESVMREIADYFHASASAGFTERTVELVNRGATMYRDHVRPSRWFF